MKIPNRIQAFLCRLNPVSIFNRIRTFARGFNPVPCLLHLWQGMAARLRQCRLGLARLVPYRISRAVMLSILSVVVVLAGIGSCRSRLAHPKPRFTMAMLDSRAAAHIRKAKAAIPDVVADICHERGHLYWLMVKDKCLGGKRARQYIAQKLDKRIVVPLRQAAAVYKCAVNADAAVGMTEEVALDVLAAEHLLHHSLRCCQGGLRRLPRLPGPQAHSIFPCQRKTHRHPPKSPAQGIHHRVD